MSDVYYLKDTKTGYIEGKFVVKKADTSHVDGVCYDAVSWIGPDNPIDFQLLADVYCKWDACTHWYFEGEDYDPETATHGDNPDGYYHLCSGDGFNHHIRLMCFVWKLVADIMGEDRVENYFEVDTTRKLVDLMLDGYEIVKAEG